jgi:hypothetical protein
MLGTVVLAATVSTALHSTKQMHSTTQHVMTWHVTARPYLVPRGELNGELRALLKGLARPVSGDVAQQYLKASSLGWLAAR